MAATVISSLKFRNAKMGLKMKLFMAVICLLHVSGKPFAETYICHVRERFECGKEPCVCPSDSSKLSSWLNLLNVVAPGFTKRCVCRKICDKVVEVKCENGTCDRGSQKCNCFPCWTGTSCSVYENLNKPKFPSTFIKINMVNQIHESKVIGRVQATDADNAKCTRGHACLCADIKYSLLDGGDNTFSINTDNGEIVLLSAPFKDDYLLVIAASNINDNNNISTIYVQINTRNYESNLMKVPHFRQRRAVSAGTLVLTMKPKITTKFYYNAGEQVVFALSLTHNASVSALAVSDVNIYVTSDFLSLTTVGLVKSKTGSFSTAETMHGDTLKIVLGSTFAGGNKYDANITTTVKNTIGPLSNLKLSAELNASSDVHLKATSSPVIYAVYPKVNLTRLQSAAVSIYGTTNFSMKIEFPKLNYSLLAELTTNIEDFIFMEIQNVRVVNQGINVQYNGSAIPKYYSTNGDGKKDRVVIDFGFLQNNADTQNTMEILFTVKVLDHVLVANNSKHWIGIGIQAGVRVLWVEQQAFYILKKQPSLEVEMIPANFTNATRLYIGDYLPVQYTIKHTNTSTANANKVSVICIFEHLLVPQSEISSNKVSSRNSTSVLVKPNANAENALALGSSLTGLFNLQLQANVTPFIETKVKFVVNYENLESIAKDPVVKEMTPAILVGTPTIIMSVNSSNNLMQPGQRRFFTVKVLLTKMRSPIRFELVMPLIGNKSIYHIVAVDDAVIGSNVKGLNKSAKPVLKSTMNDNINNQAIYDLGTGINTNTSAVNSLHNTISVTFEVVLLDHNNVTNNSEHWVGAGLVGKPKMIWVGQIVMKTIIPADDRPWLYMKPSIFPGVTASKLYPDYEYNVFLKHKSQSTQLAYNVKVRFFLPSFIQFLSMTLDGGSRLTQKQFGGSRFFEIDKPFNFVDSFNFTFKVQIDPSKFPHDGKVFITTPVYLLYKNRLGQQFTLVKLLRTSVNVPVTPAGPNVVAVNEHYDKGISWHVADAQYTLYICSDAKAKRMLSACYVTKDNGNTWNAMDSRVASINGHDNAGNIFGIAKNKRAYLKYDLDVNAWVSIPKSQFQPISSRFVKFTSSDAQQTVGPDQWKVSQDGVFIKPNGGSNWIQKSIWL